VVGGAEGGLDLRSAAAHLGVSQKTIRRWIKSGRLAAELVPGPRGDHYRVRVSDLWEQAQTIADESDNPESTGQSPLVRTEPELRGLVAAISAALDERDSSLRGDIAALRQEVQLLRQYLEARDLASDEAAESLARSGRRWWQFWRLF
jgi:MerR family transcriptional regulator, copper efflux regulator